MERFGGFGQIGYNSVMFKNVSLALATATLVAGFVAVPHITGSGGIARADGPRPDGPKCQCRYQGHRFQLGEFACINSRLARCEMFLNNTTWTFLEDTCPTSHLTPLPQSQPVPHSTPVALSN